MAESRSATADAQSPLCPGGEDGEPGAPGPIGPQGSAGPQGEKGKSGVTTVRTVIVSPSGPVAGGGSRTSDRVAKLRIKADRGDVVPGPEGPPRGQAAEGPPDRRPHLARADRPAGLERGVYVVRVTARVNGRKFLHKHLYRVRYGNPRGGIGESLNTRTIVRL
jgi:hypothetical protein